MYKTERLHKLLPLLEDFPVELVEGWKDLFKLKQTKVDKTVVMIDSFGRWGLYGIVTALLLQASLVVRLRGEFFREQRERFEACSGAFRWIRYYGNVLLAKLCFRISSLVICNSQYLAWAMVPYLENKPLAVVHNPYTVPTRTTIDEPPYGLPLSGFHLLTITNLTFQSKTRPVLEAIGEWTSPELWESLNLHWTICGTGYYENDLQALVQEQRLEERVHLLGWANDVSSLYDWCDVLVHPTRLESLGNVVMEAFMQGRPVITNSNSCGVRELVRDRENGYIVDDAASFVAALQAYAADPALRERHSRAGRELVQESFSVETQRLAMQRALNELLPLEENFG